MLEPISPELVLVDSELGRKVRARLLQDDLLEALAERRASVSVAEPAPPLRFEAPELKPAREPELARQPVVPVPPAEPPPPQTEIQAKSRRLRLAPALLPVSLAINAVLIALSVSDARVAQTSPTPPPAIDTTMPDRLAPSKPAAPKKAHRGARTAKPKATAPSPAARKAKKRAQLRPAAALKARAAAEQKVLTVVIQSPAGKLPRALINPSTGLARNGLQARCRLSGSRSFLCVIQPAKHKLGEGLYVRYRRGMKGASAFTWYRYRSSSRIQPG